MGLYKRKDSPLWWMSFCHDRRQYKRSTGAAARKTAERIYAKVRTMLVEGQWFEFDEASRHTFDEMMAKYFEYSRLHNRPATYKNTATYIKHLSENFAGRTLNKITAETIACYRDRRLSEGISPQTAAHEMGCLNHAFNLAVREWRWVRNNPGLNVKKPRVNNQILRWLTGITRCSQEVRDAVMLVWGR